MQRVVVGAGLIAVLAVGARGQGKDSRPQFEVASVKRDGTGGRGSMDFSRGGDRFTATNMPLGAIILVAYNITARQLEGPMDAFSERYDIAAKADHPLNANTMLRMLQSLLADRFKLAIHRETREVPVYALTVGKGGPKLKPSEAAAGPRTPAGAGGTEVASGHISFQGESMADFAWALSRMAAIGDRVVVDQTGLKGAYEFELRFERESPESLGPSIFEAVQEQLGLKLVSTRAPVEFLVVDHVEKPGEN